MMTGKVYLNRVLITLTIGMWALAWTAGAPAQSSYSSGGWQDPSAKNSVQHTERALGYQVPPERHDEVRMRKFLKELRSLIRDARQARAANPGSWVICASWSGGMIGGGSGACYTTISAMEISAIIRHGGRPAPGYVCRPIMDLGCIMSPIVMSKVIGITGVTPGTP